MDKVFKKEELAGFEGWRGVLATIVVIAHVFQIFYYPMYAPPLLVAVVGGIANIAVIIFFILSGMLICLSIRNLTVNNDFNWKQYLINRFLRIYPGLVIILAICVLLRYLLPLLNGGSIEIFHLKGEKNLPRTDYQINGVALIKSIFMLQPGILNVDGPLWSLFIEWWVYISAMFLTLGVISKKFVNKFVFLLGALFAIGLSIYGYGKHGLFLVAVWYAGFIYTMFANKLLLRKAYLLVSGILIITSYFCGGLSIFNIGIANKYYFGMLQLAAGLLSFSLITKITPGRFFKLIAKYSYTLYILHFPLLLFVFFITRKYIGNNPSLVIVTSILSFSLIFVCSKVVSKYAERKHNIKAKAPEIKNGAIKL